MGQQPQRTMLCCSHQRGEVYAEQPDPALITLSLGPDDAQGLQSSCGLRRYGTKYLKIVRSSRETHEDTMLVN
jgi:hypothetical protein